MAEWQDERPEARTLNEIEAIVQGSGLWEGTGGPMFSNDREVWRDAWVPSEGRRWPDFAKAWVARKGVENPVTAIVAWDEVVPTDSRAAALWRERPRTMLGAAALRQVYRRGFADVVRIVHDEERQASGEQAVEPAPRDWAAEIAEAEGMEELERLWGEARQARARTGQLEVAYRRRVRELANRQLRDAQEAGEETQQSEATGARRVPSPADVARSSSAPARKRGRR